MKTRHENKGLRKLCGHPRRAWAKCACAWHFNYKPSDPTRLNPESKDGGYRFSLDKYLDKHLDSRSEAEDEAAKIRIAIKAGKFGAAAPMLDQMTIAQLLDTYVKRHVAIERKESLTNVGYQVGTIKRVEIEQINGKMLAFGAWRVADVTSDTILRFKETRETRGVVACNRDLAFLSSFFNWAILAKYIKESPFKVGTETMVKLRKEHPRDRRLHDGEEEALQAVSGPHLRAIVTAALETGCRRGEILSLQWSQVEGMKIDDQKVTWAPGEATRLFLPHQKTKTKKDRRIPIPPRLRSLLEMRRFDPNGQPHALDLYVFGTEIGGRLLGFQRAWHTAVLKSHGVTPEYVNTNLTPKCRQALKEIGLHFHDLRREAGSRWMDLGVSIATIQRWLGHSNVSQTSAYLAPTETSDQRQADAYEARRAALQRIATDAGSGHQSRPQSDTGMEEKPNENAVGHDTRIM